MSVHLVTFSTDDMSRSRDLCLTSAMRNGVRWPREWTLAKLLDSSFGEGKSADFWQSRGVGYWSWKPFIVEQELNHCEDNEILIYADAGVEFISDVTHIIRIMEQDTFLFGNNWEHAHWCKRDIIDEVWPLNAVEWRILLDAKEPEERLHTDLENLTWERFGKQVQASVIFFRVNDWSREFVNEWLRWSRFEGGRLIDDSPSRTPNHPQFQENRHDQAILTTMAYRDGYQLHYWPASYNDGAFVYEKLPCYARDGYPILFHHHRRRDFEWK